MVLGSLGFPGLAQQAILKDTVTYPQAEGNITVIQTVIRQYFNDSSCLWEISFPRIDGLHNREVQASINRKFSEHASFGDCDLDEGCYENEQWYPRMQFYWNKVEITAITHDLLSFQTSEQMKPHRNQKSFGQIDCYFMDLKTGAEIVAGELLKSDARPALDELIIWKLGFEPEQEPFQTMRQYYLEGHHLIVLYDRYTLADDKVYRIAMNYKEIKDWLIPQGYLANYFNPPAE